MTYFSHKLDISYNNGQNLINFSFETRGSPMDLDNVLSTFQKHFTILDHKKEEKEEEQEIDNYQEMIKKEEEEIKKDQKEVSKEPEELLLVTHYRDNLYISLDYQHILYVNGEKSLLVASFENGVIIPITEKSKKWAKERSIDIYEFTFVT